MDGCARDAVTFGTAMDGEKERMVLAFCISDSFARHAAVVVASALESNPAERFDFHILSGDLSAGNRARLRAMEGARARFFFHAVDRARFAAYPIVVEHFSQEIFYRYLIPELLTGRVLYSDVDVCVRGSLRALWETPLTAERPLAAVREFGDRAPSPVWRAYRRRIGMPEDAPYFYSGLLPLDCDRLRREDATRRLLADTTQCAGRLGAGDFAASDQVVINRVFAGRIHPLPDAYCVTGALRKRHRGPCIIRHYAGYYEKPWCNVAWNRTWGTYWRLLRKTPYKAQAWGFLWGHLRALVWSAHTKNGCRRTFLLGIRVRKSKARA